MHVVLAFFIFSPHENINFGDLRCSEWVRTPPPIFFNFWCIPVFLYIVIPRHSKVRDIMVYLLSKKLHCVSVRPLVTISFPLYILSTFQPILFNLYVRVVVREHRWINLSNKHRAIALYVEMGFGTLS